MMKRARFIAGEEEVEEVQAFDSDYDEEKNSTSSSGGDLKSSSQNNTLQLTTATLENNSAYFKHLQQFPAGKFRFVTTQSAAFATLGMCFASLFPDMRLVISEEGIVGTCLNTSHTVMARWVLHKNEMVEGLFYPPKKTQEIVVDVPDFANQLAACAKADTMCISLDDDENPEKIIIDLSEEDVTGHLEMSLNVPEEHLEIPPIKYNNRVVISSDEFRNKLHLRTDARDVYFDLNKDRFTLTLHNTRGKMAFAWPLDTTGDGALVAEKHILTPQKFMLTQILNVARITKATKYVSISMPERRDKDDPNSSKKPLLISYQLVMGTVSFFIAPCVADENDDVALEDDNSDED